MVHMYVYSWPAWNRGPPGGSPLAARDGLVGLELAWRQQCLANNRVRLMAWMPQSSLRLPPKRLAWDCIQQPDRNQLLIPPAQPTKNRDKVIPISPSITPHLMLTIKKSPPLGPN